MVFAFVSQRFTIPRMITWKINNGTKKMNVFVIWKRRRWHPADVSLVLTYNM